MILIAEYKRVLHNYAEKEKIEKICQIEPKFACNSLLLPIILVKS